MNCWVKILKRLFLGLLFFISVPTMSLAVEMPLIGIQGNKVNLSSYQGQWIVVNYWATWCPPCIIEMPELQAFHDEHADKDAMVIGINVEHISKLQLQEFLENYFITYPIFVSKPTQQSELGLIPGLPTTFLVNPQGKVVARQVGPVTREMIEQFIQNRQSQ